MTHFTLAGMPQCHLFNHGRYVADFLTERLPNFKVNIIEKSVSEWPNWLKEINVKNKWYHEQSPIVWKELTMRGGRPHYIGGLSEFWEYCYDYYGLESILPKQEVTKIVDDYLQYYMDKRKKSDVTATAKQKYIMCITGDQNNLISLLVMQLLDLDLFSQEDEVIIKIYTQNDNDIIDVVDAAAEIPAKFKYSIEHIHHLGNGLRDCKLLIVTGDFARETNEEFYKWLNRNYLSMCELSEVLNLYAPRKLRVILAMHGPVCFNASVLVELVTTIQLHNIVAVTADLGLEALNTVSKLTDMPLKDLSAPPVWGFVGINHLIDLEHTIQRYDVYKPNLRAVKNKYGSTLPLGKMYSELRFMSYLSKDFPNVWIEMNKNRVNNPRSSHYSKVRSIISLIQNWSSQTANGNIISLGVLSDGSFGIPPGIIFSQSVQFKNSKWTPMKTFPKPRNDPCGIEDLFSLIHDVMKYFKFRDESSSKI